MKKLFFLLFSFSFLMLKCPDAVNPDVDGLPPITQTGASTMGCLINGKVWIPSAL